jgi:hypothetical protein
MKHAQLCEQRRTAQGKAGFAQLGQHVGRAIERAAQLNEHLDAWRDGRGAVKSLDVGRRFGTVAWLFERYRRSPAFERVSERSRPEYRRALARIEDVPTKSGGKVGDLPVASITQESADIASRGRNSHHGRGRAPLTMPERFVLERGPRLVSETSP